MSRFGKKIDYIFWFIISITPLIVYFVSSWNNPNTIDFSSFIANYRFTFIANIFNSIFTDTFIFPTALVDFISYFCSVEIIHVFVDFVVFIPRFAHNLTDKFYGG